MRLQRRASKKKKARLGRRRPLTHDAKRRAKPRASPRRSRMCWFRSAARSGTRRSNIACWYFRGTANEHSTPADSVAFLWQTTPIPILCSMVSIAILYPMSQYTCAVGDLYFGEDGLGAPAIYDLPRAASNTRPAGRITPRGRALQPKQSPQVRSGAARTGRFARLVQRRRVTDGSTIISIIQLFYLMPFRTCCS